MVGIVVGDVVGVIDAVDFAGVVVVVGIIVGVDVPGVTVTGQIVVETAMVDVMTMVEDAGQTVTVGAQLVMVTSDVV